MTSKRDVLLAICETPGWQPPADIISVADHLDQLFTEGWIAARQPHGYEATPKALDAYPRFAGQDDIADPDATSPATKFEAGSNPSQELKLPSLFIRNEQRTEAKFHVGTVQGTVVISNEQSQSPLVEVTLTVNVKPAR